VHDCEEHKVIPNNMVDKDNSQSENDAMKMKGKTEDDDEEEGSISMAMGTKSDCLESSFGRGKCGGGLVKSLPPPPHLHSHSHNSPPSLLECDNHNMNATHQHQTLDIESLHESHSNRSNRLDNNNSISSNANEFLVQGSKKESISSDGVSTNNVSIEYSGFVANEVSSPAECAADDFMFCRLECGFPDVFQDVNESRSNDLCNLIFQLDTMEMEEKQ